MYIFNFTLQGGDYALVWNLQSLSASSFVNTAVCQKIYNTLGLLNSSNHSSY